MQWDKCDPKSPDSIWYISIFKKASTFSTPIPLPHPVRFSLITLVDYIAYQGLKQNRPHCDFKISTYSIVFTSWRTSLILLLCFKTFHSSFTRIFSMVLTQVKNRKSSQQWPSLLYRRLVINLYWNLSVMGCPIFKC